MKHLTAEQLTARLDDALAGRALEEVDRHLAGCATCRDALAEFATQDRMLAAALSHDPGEAYFESFADRVGSRIRAEGMGGAQQTHGRRTTLGDWMRSPRKLAWLGGVAALIAGAGIVLMMSREVSVPLRRSPVADRLEQTTPAPAASEFTAPPQAVTDKDDAVREKREAAPATDAIARQSKLGAAAAGKASGTVAAPQAAQQNRVASPGHMVELRRDPVTGEDVPVERENAPRFSPPPAAPIPVPGGGVRIPKQRFAQPAQRAGARDEGASGQPAPKPFAVAPPVPEGMQKSLAPGAAQEEMKVLADERTGTGHVCGEVRDPSGRAVAGAEVVATDVGRSATTDSAGRFCLDLPPGDRALSVMAVGFRPTRQTLHVEGDTGALALMLQPVSVLPGTTGEATRAMLREAGGEPRDAFTPLPTASRALARAAQKLTATAAATKSAAGYDLAAEAWARVMPQVTVGKIADDVRFELASARFHAWELSPNDRRAKGAVETLNAFIAAAPEGTRRDQASRWLGLIAR